jgi:membrane protein YqaA with SNARE-associated domain
MVPCTPLKYTVSTEAFVPNPAPVIVTTVFLGPDVGLIVATESAGSGVGGGVGVALSFFLQDTKANALHTQANKSFFIQD